MPLVGLNRLFVQLGLRLLNEGGNTGLKTLCAVAGLSEVASAYHLGFMLGPRINAGGRVGESSLGSELLSTNDISLAAEIASRLDAYNDQRQTIEKSVLTEAIQLVESQQLEQQAVVLVGASLWHPGVVGIVASRLKERFNKPAIVVGKGSGRSIPGVPLGDVILEAVKEGLLLNGGGHAMAVGLSVSQEKFEDFRAYLTDRLATLVADNTPMLTIDTEISLALANSRLVEALTQLEPFGMGNPQPRFLLSNVTVIKQHLLRNGEHCRFLIKDVTGQTVNVLAFRIQGTGIETTLGALTPNTPVDLVVTIKKDTYRGTTSVVLTLEDLRLSASSSPFFSIEL